LNNQIEQIGKSLEDSKDENAKLRNSPKNTPAKMTPAPPSGPKEHFREGLFGVDNCTKQESVFFLKTSKTGSTTLSSILARFGYSRIGFYRYFIVGFLSEISKFRIFEK